MLGIFFLPFYNISLIFLHFFLYILTISFNFENLATILIFYYLH